MSPRSHRHPPAPGRRHRAAAPGREALRPGLQPVVDLEPAGAPALRGDRRARVVDLPQPGAGADQRRAHAVAAPPPVGDFPARLQLSGWRFRELHERHRDLVRAQVPVLRERADRLLLDGVRGAPLARPLLGRPGGALRRPLQERQRPRAAVRGGGSALPPRLLPPDGGRRRPPAAHLPRVRLPPPADAPRRHPHRPRGDRQGAVPGPRDRGQGLGGAGRAGAVDPPRHRSGAQRSGRPPDRQHPLHPGPRDPAGAGDGARHRRRAGAARAGHRARGLAHERGPLGAAPARAAARAGGGEEAAGGRGAGADRERRRSSPRTLRCRRGTSASSRSWSPPTSASTSRRSARRPRRSWRWAWPGSRSRTAASTSPRSRCAPRPTATPCRGSTPKSPTRCGSTSCKPTARTRRAASRRSRRSPTASIRRPGWAPSCSRC